MVGSSLRCAAAMAALALAVVSTCCEAAGKMSPVRVIQARVQGDEPEWDAEHQTFVSAYGDSFPAKYRAVMDTVNTASVEGALMFVQAEGINARTNAECERKNKMQYIVFYEFHILQPDAALAAFDGDATTFPEYSPFVAMDGGACSASGDALPEECVAIFGSDSVVRLGPSVGASKRDTDPRAPYPNTVWFSYPNSCVTKTWAEKDSTCRRANPGGLCAFGSEPDGEVCAFTYKTLGYLRIDDLVGITNLTSSVTGELYSNYTEFCLDKDGEYEGIEFDASETPTNSGGDDTVTSLPFWEHPYDMIQNAQRAQKMINMYNALASENDMTVLPTPAELTDANPPCYENSLRCAQATHGCKRELYAQTCRVCDEEEDGCVKKSYDLSRRV